MGLFSFFCRKKLVNTPDVEEKTPDDESRGLVMDERGIISYGGRVDHLGLAALAKRSALDAVGRGDYNSAWSFISEQQEHYINHARCNRWSPRDVLSIDGKVSADFAYILYKEGKHKQALVHIVYWTSTARNVIKDHDKKLGAYFKRCKFENITLDAFKVFADECRKRPDYVQIQNRIAEMS